MGVAPDTKGMEDRSPTDACSLPSWLCCFDYQNPPYAPCANENTVPIGQLVSISVAMLNMRQPICCSARQTLPGLDKPPRILTMLHCLTVGISMRMHSLSGLSFLR